MGKSGKQSKTDTETWTTTICAEEVGPRATDLGLDDPMDDPDPEEPVNVTRHEQHHEVGCSIWITAEFRGRDITDGLSDLEQDWLALVLEDKKRLSRVERDRLRYRTAAQFLSNDFIFFLPGESDDEYDWLAPLSDPANSSLGPLLAALASLEAGAPCAEAVTKWYASAAKLLGESDFLKSDDDAAVDACPMCGMSNPETPFPERLSSALDRLKDAVDTYWEKQQAKSAKQEEENR